jgi:hypothetical protein
MGVEFALVHDETKEAFELGKGYFDWREGIPADRDGVRKFIVELFGDWEFVDPTTDRIWTFIESHPGCRLVSDTSDDAFWTTNPDEDAYRSFGRENVFRQVGSAYAPRPSPSGGEK